MPTFRQTPWIDLLNRLLVLTVAIAFVASAVSIAYSAGRHTSAADSVLTAQTVPALGAEGLVSQSTESVATGQ